MQLDSIQRGREVLYQLIQTQEGKDRFIDTSNLELRFYDITYQSMMHHSENFCNTSTSQSGTTCYSYDFKEHRRTMRCYQFYEKIPPQLSEVEHNRWQKDYLVHRVKELAKELSANVNEQEDLKHYFLYKIFKGTSIQSTEQFLSEEETFTRGGWEKFTAFVGKKTQQEMRSAQEKEERRTHRASPEYKAAQELKAAKDKLDRSISEFQKSPTIKECIESVQKINPSSINGKQLKEKLLGILEELSQKSNDEDLRPDLLSLCTFDNNFNNILTDTRAKKIKGLFEKAQNIAQAQLEVFRLEGRPIEQKSKAPPPPKKEETAIDAGKEINQEKQKRVESKKESKANGNKGNFVSLVLTWLVGSFSSFFLWLRNLF